MTHTVRLSQFEAMKKERDELAAQVERLRQAIEEHRMGCDEECVCTEDEILWRVLCETPAQSLEAVKAGALDNEARLMLEAPQKSANGAFDMRVVAKILRERAKQIRSGDD